MSYQALLTELNAIRSRLRPRLEAPCASPQVVLVPGHLSIAIIVQEDDGNQRYVTQAEFARWGTTPEALLPIALENLRGTSSPKHWAPVRQVPGMQVYLASEGNSAARALLLPEIFGSAWPLEGILVAMPTPHQLMIVPLDRVEDLSAFHIMLVAANIACKKGPETLTNQMFWFDGKQWTHIEVRHEEDNIEVVPDDAFLAALERLSAMSMTSFAGEA